jgi:hypothetical protein
MLIQGTKNKRKRWFCPKASKNEANLKENNILLQNFVWQKAGPKVIGDV